MGKIDLALKKLYNKDIKKIGGTKNEDVGV